MADNFSTPDNNITGKLVSTDQDTGFSTYLFTNKETGLSKKLDLGYTREQIIPLFNKNLLSEPGLALAKTMAPVFDGLRSTDERGFGSRVVAPIARSLPAYFAGGVPDIMALLSYVPNPGQLAAMGYEALTGDDPFGSNERRRKGAKQTRELAKDYGTEAQQGRFSQYLRQADKWAQDNWGFKPFEDSIGTDMTPDARGIWERILAGALEVGTSGPVMAKGVVAPAKLLQDGAQYLFSRFAKESARELGEAAATPENYQSLISKANAAYSLMNKGGRRNIRQEFNFGFAGGAATEASLGLLEEADPEAAGWVKASVALGAGLLAPVAARGAVTSLLEGPVLSRVADLVVNPFLRPAEAASRFVQKNLGVSFKDRAAVVSVSRLLEDAVKNGEHLEAAAGLALTTPELARTKAKILKAEISIKRDQLSLEQDPEIQKRLRGEIEADEATSGNLLRTASFYEAVLESAAKDRAPGVAARFFQDEAKRLVERRKSFFDSIEGTFKRAYDDLDFNGKPGGTPDELRVDLQKAKGGGIPEFEATRRTLVMEGNPKGIEASELLWLDPQTKDRVGAIQQDLSAVMDEALGKAQSAALDRVDFLNDSVQLYLRNMGLKTVADLPAAEGRMVGDLIRGTYDDAAREYRAFEKAAYARVNGLENKVTENIVFPKGSKDPSNNADISGMTVEQWAASRFENLSPEEAFNPTEVSKHLAQLAGSRSVSAQLRRKQGESAASGKISNADEAIPNLERRRNDAIAQRDEVEVRLKDQIDADRVLSENNNRTLQTYIANAVEKLDDAGRRAVNDFANTEMDWVEMSVDTASGLAPKGLGKIFSEITKQKKRILELGEGVTSSKEVRALDNKMEGFAEAAKKAQRSIDEITNKYMGVGDDVQVPETGRLTARDATNGLVRDGTSAEDVRSFISDVEDSARIEKATNGNSNKHRRIRQLREVVEQLIAPENFPELDAARLNFARETSRFGRTVRDAQGPVLEKTRGSEVKVDVESVAESVLPPQKKAQASAAKLRLLQEATAEVPDFVKITRNADGTAVASINEAALDGAESLFALESSPFEMISVGQGRTDFEIRLKQGAPVTDRSLKVAESIILERLSFLFPKGVDSKRLEAFRSDNSAAIKFLEDNGRPGVPDLIKEADSLSVQLDSMAALRRDKTKNKLTELVNQGYLDLNGFKIEDYLEYIGKQRSRASEDYAFAEIFGADPGRATETLFNKILDPRNNRPKQDFQQFMSLVRGNKQAEKGLRASVVGQLYNRSLTYTEELARETSDLAMQAFDPTKFRELIRNSRVQDLIQEAFPDNPEILSGLEDLALSAFETSNFTQGSTALAMVDPSNAVNLTGWAFLGRISALGLANASNLVNQLWAGAAGSQAGKLVGMKVTGGRIKDLMIDAALYPEQAVALGLRVGQQGNGFFAALGQSALDTVGTPFKRPGSSSAIIKRAEEELDEGDVGPQASLQQVSPPAYSASAVPLRQPISASGLSNASPVSPSPTQVSMAPASRPTAQGTSSQEVIDLGRKLFGANDTVFANQGGYIGRPMEHSGIMSVRNKPRQLVG